MPIPEDHSQLSPVAALFAEFLARCEQGRGDLEAFCRDHPAHAVALRHMHAVWLGIEGRLPRTDAPPAGAASGHDVAHLLAELGAAEGQERYVEAGEIARGGMGVVVEVFDRRLRRPLAKKVLRDQTGGSARESAPTDTRSLGRFLDEALVTAQLEHPGIVPVYDLDLDPQRRVYFTMRLVRGRSFEEVIDLVRRAQDGWTLPRALGVMLRVCEAMAYAHSRGVIHRDLKPSNVMVGRFGETYVMDWGLARVTACDEGPGPRPWPEAAAASSEVRSVRRAVSARSPDTPLLTMEGDIVGTPAYMAPEQARGEVARVGPGADVYALGAMLYHLVAGEMPYARAGERPSARAVLALVKEGPPRPLSELAPRAPGELIAICERAMAREPEQRYAGVAALAEDLRAFLENRVVRAYETGAIAELRKWVRRNRGMALAAAAAVVALIVGLGMTQRANRLLGDELRAGNLERGRLFARTGNVRDAETLLWREHLLAPDVHSLWALRELYSHEPCLATFTSHHKSLDVLFTPDGALVSAGDDGTIRLWSPPAWQCLDTLAAHHGDVVTLSLASDGRTLASGGRDGQLVLWDLGARRRIAAWSAHDKVVHSVCFYPATDRLASSGIDGSGAWRVWNIRTRECLQAREHGAFVHEVCVASAGGRELVATAGADGVVKLWHSSALPLSLIGHEDAVVSLAFAPDGRLLSGSRDRTVRIWDTTTGQCLQTLRMQNGTVRRLRLLPGGSSFLAAGWFGVDLVDLPSARTLRSFRLPATANGLAVDREGRFAVALGSGGMRILEESVARNEVLLPGHAPPAVVAPSPDGALLATGDKAGCLRLWERRTGRMLEELARGGPGVRSLRFDPRGKRLAVGRFSGSEPASDRPGTVELWDLQPRARRSVWPDYDPGASTSIDFSADGELLAFTQAGGRIALVDLGGAGDARALDMSSRQALSVRFGPVGRILAATARGGRLALWKDPAGPPCWLARDTPTASWSLAFDREGRTLAVGGFHADVDVFDVGDTHPRAHLSTHANVWAVDFHPLDRDLLACADAQGFVYVWHVPSQRLLLKLDRFDGQEVTSVAFARGAGTLAAAGKDPAVRIWSLTAHDRDIAANLRHQIDLLRPELGNAIAADALTRWAAGVLEARAVPDLSSR